MPFRRFNAGLAGAALVLALYPAIASGAPNDVVASPAASGGSSPAATIRYWTAERMRRARPVTTTLRRRVEPARTPAPKAPGPPRYVAGIGDAPFTTSEGKPSTYPDRTHGKVFFRLGRNSWVCSATVVHSQAGNVVVTAGHCVHGGRRKDFATRWVFVPGYDEGVRPFGKFPFKRLYALRGWTRRSNFNFDIATARVKGNKFGAVEKTVGSRGIGWDQPRELDFDVYGYPVEGDFDHRRLYFCRTSYAFDDPDPAPRGRPPLGVGCDLTAGASGGGWVTSGPEGTPSEPFVNSVTSFGYDHLDDVLFGPYFAARTAGKLWSRASGEPIALAALRQPG